LETAAEVGRISAAPGDIEERANALIAPLRRLVGFQAACIVLIGQGQPVALPLVSEGYDGATQGYIESPANVDEIEMLGFHRERAPMRLQDLPVPPEQVPGWVEYLEPAGFKGGLAVGLFAADGRYVGLLGMNSDDAERLTESMRDFVGRLAPMIANAIDPMRSIAEASRIVHNATAGIILTAASRTLSLPGLPSHAILAVGSALLLVVNERIAAGRAHGSFLCPLGPPGMPAEHVRITLLSFPPRPPQYLVAAVLISPAGNTNGLTARELEVLGLLVEGWPNQRIAPALFITERTVASHVEHIVAKLAVPSRTLAAVRALRNGLYVPPALNRVPPR
jgi:DNA-binding CsgD family transcriptional regulator